MANTKIPIELSSTPSIVDGGNATAITIDSSENVGIGCTPVATLQVKTQTNGNLAFQNSTSVSGGVKLNCFNDAANASSPFEIDGSTLQFNIGSSEKMRIDSSGNFLVGKTANTQASTGFQIDGSNLHNVTSTNSGTGSSTYMVHDGSGLNFYVNYTGEVNYKVALTNLSDQRLKENIVNLDKGLNDILKIKPRRFDWIEGEGEKNQMGFIAQEVEEAGLEELVRPFKGGSLDDAKGVNQTGFIAILVKAIQEQQAIIEDLQTQINEVKNGN